MLYCCRIKGKRIFTNRCRQDKDKLVAEYALKDINKPVGVSEYKLLQDIPEYLQSQLPKAEDIELHIKDIEEIEKQQDNEE